MSLAASHQASKSMDVSPRGSKMDVSPHGSRYDLSRLILDRRGSGKSGGQVSETSEKSRKKSISDFIKEIADLERHNQLVLTEKRQALEQRTLARTMPVALFAVHIMQCEKVDILGLGFDTTKKVNVFLKIYVGKRKNYSIAISTYTMSKLFFDFVKHFRVELSSAPDDKHNYFKAQLWGYQDLLAPRLIGMAEIHLFQCMRDMGGKKTLLLLRNGNYVGKLKIEYAFMYGSFGYGFSNQLQNKQQEPTSYIMNSVFPRANPRVGADPMNPFTGLLKPPLNLKKREEVGKPLKCADDLCFRFEGMKTAYQLGFDAVELFKNKTVRYHSQLNASGIRSRRGRLECIEALVRRKKPLPARDIYPVLKWAVWLNKMKQMSQELLAGHHHQKFFQRVLQKLGWTGIFSIMNEEREAKRSRAMKAEAAQIWDSDEDDDNEDECPKITLSIEQPSDDATYFPPGTRMGNEGVIMHKEDFEVDYPKL